MVFSSSSILLPSSYPILSPLFPLPLIYISREGNLKTICWGIRVSGINFFAVNSCTAMVAAVMNFTQALLTIPETSRETVYVKFSLTCVGVA